jgi:hypothetical protein
MKIKTNSLIINASAGHGKDYTTEIIQKSSEEKTEIISFSETIKFIVSRNLNYNIQKQFPKNTHQEILDILKNDRHDIKIIGNLNMRAFLQNFMGDNILRKINPTINILFTAQKMKESLLENNDTIFLCNDNRYENEQEFLLKFNQIEKESKIDYLNDYIKENQSKMEDLNILNFLENELNKISNQDNTYKSMIIRDFMTIHSKTRKYQEPKQNGFQKNILKDFNYEDISNMSIKEGLNMGIINIFRPLIPLDTNKNTKLNEIKSIIEDFHSISKKEIENISKNYSNFNIDFNIENIKKYGFLRADPNHISEKILNKRKPEYILNLPENFFNLKDFFKKQFIVEIKKNIKKHKI